ncbi:MAG: serine/threonine protein kinase, partial [Planctomycetes bacterium]|nr:serine/threonine protein kinase [Planctomycetota bacterium]
MTDRGTYALLEELDAAKHAGRSVVPSALAERYGVALDRVLRLAAGLGALEALTGPERASVAEPNPKSAVEGVWRETVGSGEGIDPQQSCRPASFAPFGAADSAESSLYRLEEEIGRGGMGVVYKAEQSRLRRPVAVKQLPRGERSSDQTRAFFAEALTAAWLDHPNIIPVYDMEGSSSSNGAALLMKLVEGESWLSLLHPETEEQKALAADYDLAAHLQVFLQVCNGVAFAHSRGIAHLDLKPENVMVGAFGEVLVVDWGLAVDVRDRPSSERRARPRAWFHLNPAGTPSYMAPEMALGRASHIGAWTDVYLLGATLYHVLAGRPPHRGGDVWETLLTAARSEPDPLPEEHPEELREICGRALARQPRRRFQSVETFQAAIREFLEHRESVRLADEARVTLGECQVARARGAALSDGDRRRLYSDHARALFGFERAQALWQDNATAEVGQRDAQRSYAQSALTLGDLGLAEALVDELGDDREAEPLLESVREERRGKKRAVKQQRRVRLALRGTIGLIVFGVIGGVFLSQQLERGARQEQLATTLAEAREEAGRAADAFSRARA